VQSVKVERAKKKRFSLTKVIEKYIRAKLKQDWSPEQIAGRMKLDTGASVVHETIYRYIYTNKLNGGKLYTYLRHKNKKYHHRSNDYRSRGTMIDRVMIDKRPKIVEKKSRIGDWEIDTVVGKAKEGLFVDYKTKLVWQDDIHTHYNNKYICT
jgi:IS30 family transposase